MRIKFIFCILLIVALFCSTLSVSALSEPVDQLPYETYVYDVQNEADVIPAAYRVEQVLRASDWGMENFRELAEVWYDGEETLYFCDAGNGRIVVTDTNLKPKTTLDSFMFEGLSETLSAPNGLCTDDQYLYVADTGNARIVVFDRQTLECQKILKKPTISLLEGDYTYVPQKIAVDEAGRIYVIANGINQGLVELDENGNFVTFLGAPSVVPDLMEQIWRELATEEQLAQLDKYVPTEYNSLLMDENGFIYATTKSSKSDPLVKLNNNGNNILDFSDTFGDAEGALRETDRPFYADMALGKNGTMALIDSEKGRIYFFTGEGELLFAFGRNASQDGTFYTASSLIFLDDKLLVTDSSKNTVTVLAPTDFGSLVLKAVDAEYSGRYEESYTLWNEVLKQCSHYPMAVLGLAKIEIRNEQYTEAMTRLKVLREMKYYDQAVAGWRDALIREYLGWILLAIAAVVALLIVVPRVVRCTALYKRLVATQTMQEYRYGAHVMLHPFDGFWDVKREKKGGMRGAVVTLVLFILLYAIRAQFSGFLATGKTSDEINALYECLMILVPIFLWIVANWCFTTLMDGEGNMKDIFVATCYALRPYIVMSIPLLIMSHVLVEKEMAFYTLGNQICLIWILGLIFFGMMTTHNYSLSKGIFTAILTLVGICLIIFIALLALNVVQDTVNFVRDIYQEIIFRTY